MAFAPFAKKVIKNQPDLAPIYSFSFEKRATRIHFLGALFGMILTGYIAFSAILSDSQTLQVLSFWICALLSVWFCSVTVRRLNDLKWDETRLVFIFLPAANIFFALFLLFVPSEWDGDN